MYVFFIVYAAEDPTTPAAVSSGSGSHRAGSGTGGGGVAP